MKIIEPGLALETDRVLLRPIEESDYTALLDLARDEGMWYYFTLNLADKNDLRKWMGIALLKKLPAQEDHSLLLIKQRIKLRAAAAWEILLIMTCG